VRKSNGKISRTERHIGLQAYVFVAAVATILGAEAGAQEEIKLFNLTDVGGTFSARYWFDERSDNNGGIGGATAKSSSWQESLLFRTQSYIYHPAFIEMRASGGPVAVQSGGNSELLFGYDVFLSALSRKRYPFSVFFRQEYPDTVTGSAGRFQVKANQYGIQGSYRPIKLPGVWTWTASRRDSFGAGFDQIVDSNGDSAGMSAGFGYGEGHNIKLKVTWDRTQSRNGSPGLPIAETSSTSRSSRLDGDNRFGKNDQFLLRHSLNRLQQTNTGNVSSDLDKWWYRANLRWKHSGRHSSVGNYRFTDTNRNEEINRSQGLNVSTNISLYPSLSTSGSARVSKNEGIGYSQKTVGGSLNANFRRDLSIGQFGLTGRVSKDRRDQQSTRDSVNIFDEPATLNGIQSVQLQEDFVVVETVIVTNAERTQTFIEDIDYRLVTIGSTTTIERLVSGNILDGQVVLVSYEFLTGGTVEYGRASQSLVSTMNMPRFANIFIGITNVENETLSGIATTPLNDSRQFEFSVSKSQSFSMGWSLSGEARMLKVEEDISPNIRTSYRVSIGFPRIKNTRIRLGINRQLVDYETSFEDVDQIRYTISVNSRLPGGFFLNYNGAIGENKGGSIFRQDERHNFQLSWRYRKVYFFMNAVQSDVMQGNSRRTDRSISANIQRLF
jgi:hypothetical protein